MNDQPDALAVLADLAARPEKADAPDPRPDEVLPTSLAPVAGAGVSA